MAIVDVQKVVHDDFTKLVDILFGDADICCIHFSQTLVGMREFLENLYREETDREFKNYYLKVMLLDDNEVSELIKRIEKYVGKFY